MTPSSISSSPTLSVSGQTITIKNAVISYIEAQTAFSFELGGIQNPSTSQPTSSFQIYTYDQSSYEIDQLTSGLKVSASLGTLTNVKIYPVNVTGVLQYATNYSVQFTIANALNTATTPSIIITFDNSVLGFLVGSSTCNVLGLNSGYTCMADSFTNSITITNFIYSSVSSG